MLSKLASLPRDARDTLFLLGVIALVVLPQTPNLPLWCTLAAAAVLLYRGYLAVKTRPLPGVWLRMGLPLLALPAAFASHGTLLGRDAGVTLVVVLLALKTLELRARRDAFVIFFLGFFAMLTNFFYSQSLLTAVAMMLALLGLLTALVNAHLPVGKPSLWLAGKTAGGMVLLGAPIMLVLFLLFPRLAPLWGSPTDAMTGRSGLSNSMTVGNIASLALDSSVAMRIRFEGAPPPQRELYFRGPVLSAFDGREWRAPRNNLAARYGVRANLQVAGPPVNYEVTLEPTSRPWLFLMEAVETPPELPGFSSAMQDDLQWTLSRPVTDLIRYKAQSFPRFTHGPMTRAPGLQELIDMPVGTNPRTLALAREIKADPRNAGATTAQLVAVVMERLRTGGYVYTLEPGVYGADTADEFWFDRKQGFCEHIASAFAVLMRSMDIPARIVTGYQGGEVNNVDNMWTVRQSDAHAWTEVWQAGQGWVRVDPTSAVAPGRTGAFQRLAAPQGFVGETIGNFSPTLMAQLRATWEAVNGSWNQWVLNYTQSRQLDLLKNIGFDTPTWEDLSYVLIGIIVLASGAGAVWTLWDRSQHDPWLRLLARARKQLARAGIASNAATSPRQLAMRLKQTASPSPGDATALHDWLMALETQRYARGDGAANQLRVLKRQFRQLTWPTA